MKKSLGFILLLLLAACVCCAVAFGFMYDNTKKQCIQLQEQIGLYQDNEKDLADALIALRECNNKIKDLENRLNKALSDGNAKDSTIAQLRQDLETANTDKLTLQNEVTRLRGLLESYQGMEKGTHEVNFWNDDVLVATRAVADNSVVFETLTATKLYHKFLGWSLDKVNIVDPSTITITEATNFYAVFEMQAGLYADDGSYTPWNNLYSAGYISSGNPTDYEYTLRAGMAYSQMSGTLVLRNSITIIENLQYCINLKAVIINPECTTISPQAFRGCNIASIYIPKTVKTIGAGAFENCPFLKIYCEETEKQAEWSEGDYIIDPDNWNSIYVGQWNGDCQVAWGYTYEQYLAEVNN